jgi:hypothetical protein
MVLSRYSDSVSCNPNYLETVESSSNYDVVQRVNAAIAAQLGWDLTETSAGSHTVSAISAYALAKVSESVVEPIGVSQSY